MEPLIPTITRRRRRKFKDKVKEEK